jgi:hypothetical protein
MVVLSDLILGAVLVYMRKFRPKAVEVKSWQGLRDLFLGVLTIVITVSVILIGDQGAKTESHAADQAHGAPPDMQRPTTQDKGAAKGTPLPGKGDSNGIR